MCVFFVFTFMYHVCVFSSYFSLTFVSRMCVFFVFLSHVYVSRMCVFFVFLSHVYVFHAKAFTSYCEKYKQRLVFVQTFRYYSGIGLEQRNTFTRYLYGFRKKVPRGKKLPGKEAPGERSPPGKEAPGEKSPEEYALST